MDGGEGKIDSGLSENVLTPPLVKEPEERSQAMIERLRNPESAVGEQERAAGAAPLVEQEHVCVQEHNVVADQGTSSLSMQYAHDVVKDYISEASRVLQQSASGFSAFSVASKSWAINLAETMLIIVAQAIYYGRPCPVANLGIHHPIQECKAERRVSDKTTVWTQAVVAEHVLGSRNPVEPKVARTARKREKRRTAKAESQRLKTDKARLRWVGGSWGTTLAAERKLAIHDAFYRHKRGVSTETRNTVREHGKCFKAATKATASWAKTRSRTINAVAWNWALGLAFVLVVATMLFETMSTGRTQLFTGLMIGQQAYISPATPMETASRCPRGSNSNVTVKRSSALVPTGSVAHPQARCSCSSRVTVPGVVAPPGNSAGRVGMSGVVAVLCIFAAYVAQGVRRVVFTGRSGGEGTTCHRRGKGKVMGNPLRLDFSSKHVSKLLLLLALLSSAHAARPWSVTFGSCVFSGDLDGAPLVRSGSCPTQDGVLDLRERNITSVKNDSFAGMGACT